MYEYISYIIVCLSLRNWMRTVPINKLVRSTHHHTSSLLRWFCGVGWMAHRGGVLYAAVQASASARRASRWRTAVSGVWDSTLDTLALGERGSWSTLFTWWSGAFCFKNDFDLLRPLLVNVVKMCKYILFRHFFSYWLVVLVCTTKYARRYCTYSDTFRLSSRGLVYNCTTYVLPVYLYIYYYYCL